MKAETADYLSRARAVLSDARQIATLFAQPPKRQLVNDLQHRLPEKVQSDLD